MGAGRNFGVNGDRIWGRLQNGRQLQSRNIQSEIAGMNIVQMQRPRRRYRARRARIEQSRRIAGIPAIKLNSKIEFARRKIESQNAVESCRRQVETAAELRNFMAVLQIGVAVRSDDLEILVKGKELVACRDVNEILKDTDAAKPAIGAAPFKVDAAIIPVKQLLADIPVEINEIKTAMTVALIGAADNGRNQDARRQRRPRHNRRSCECDLFQWDLQRNGGPDC